MTIFLNFNINNGFVNKTLVYFIRKELEIKQNQLISIAVLKELILNITNLTR